VIWLGSGFAREVIAAYDGAKDEGTADRAIYLGRAGLLGYLDAVLDAREEPPPEGIIEAQLRAAFSED
jgi:hypothetical protein